MGQAAYDASALPINGHAEFLSHDAYGDFALTAAHSRGEETTTSDHMQYQQQQQHRKRNFGETGTLPSPGMAPLPILETQDTVTWSPTILLLRAIILFVSSSRAPLLL